MSLPHTPLRFIFYFLRRQWLKFTFMLLASLIWAFHDVCLPWLLKRILETVERCQSNPAGVFLATSRPLGLLAVLWLTMELFMRLRDIVELHAIPRFRNQVQTAVFNYVKSHAYHYFTGQFAGSLAQKLNDLPNYCEYLTELICLDLVTPVVGAMMVLAFLGRLQPVFVWVLVLWLTLHLGITFLFFQRGRRLQEAHAESVSTVSGKVVDVLSNMLNVHLFARQRYESAYLARFQSIEMAKAKQAMWNNALMRVGLAISSGVLIFGMLGALLSSWQKAQVHFGDFTQVLMQSFWLLNWAWFVTFRLNDFTKDYGVINNALSLIRQPHEMQDKAGALPLAIHCGEICFEQVSFAYVPNRPVFQNLSVRILAGQKVGIVGFSGSGKSSFVNLLLRLFDPKGGRIQIDGQTIAAVTRDSLHAQISMIPQEPVLFHRSLRENIHYGRLEASDIEVIEAARQTHCHEFIMQLPAGYETLVGERGVKLSGGQRQRIAIARALLKNAPILILDEATSSLDSVTETLIQKSLRQLMQGRTTLVIAHRLSTLADMDRILVFHAGKIVEAGTQTEILKANGHFAMLWARQREGFLPDSIEQPK